MSASSPVPDGGWGWAVVVGCFTSSFVVASLPRSFGVVIIELMDKFQAPSAKIAGVLSTSQFCRYIFAPLSGVFVHRFGVRRTVFAGGILTAAGCVFASLSTSLFGLYAFYGALTGLGHCLIYTPSQVIIGVYFENRRAIATALTGLGASLSGFIIPPLLRWLFAELRVSGCLLIVGGISLHVCAGAMTMRPLMGKKDPDSKAAEAFINENEENVAQAKKETAEEVVETKCWKKFINWLGLDFTLLAQPTFLATIAGHALTNPAAVSSWAFIPLMAISKGVDDNRAALLLSVHALSDLIGGRLISSIFLDASCIRSRRYLLSPFVNLMFCVVMTGLYLSSSPIECFVWTSFYGIFHGMYVSLRNLVLQDLFGRSKLASLFSFQNCMIGIGMLTMPVILGVITDVSEIDYALIFLLVVFFLAAVLFGGVSLTVWVGRKKKNCVVT